MEPEELIKSAKSGDEIAKRKLLLHYRSFISSIISKYVYTPENRLDVLQNVFISIIKGISSFEGKCKLTTWLYRLVINECFNFARKEAQIAFKRKLTDDIDYLASINRPDPFALIGDQELRIIISQILQKFPLDQKTAVTLFYFGGYSGKEASEVMKITEANFFMKLKAARDKLKKELQARGFNHE